MESTEMHGEKPNTLSLVTSLYRGKLFWSAETALQLFGKF